MSRRNFQDSQPTRGRQNRQRNFVQQNLERQSTQWDYVPRSERKKKKKKYILDEKGEPTLAFNHHVWYRWMKDGCPEPEIDYIYDCFEVTTKFTGVPSGYVQVRIDTEPARAEMISRDREFNGVVWGEIQILGINVKEYPCCWETTFKVLEPSLAKHEYLKRVENHIKKKKPTKDQALELHNETRAMLTYLGNKFREAKQMEKGIRPRKIILD